MVGCDGVVVVVKVRKVAKSHKYEDGPCDNPGKASCERPRVFDNFLGESIRGDEKNARREAHEKVQIALDKRPRLPPRDELARKRREHYEKRRGEYFKHGRVIAYICVPETSRFQYTISMSFRRKIQNVRPSVRAILILLREEFSFRVLAISAVATLLLAYILQISRTELLFVILTIGGMLSVEALNTAIEEVCDHVTPEEHARIGKIKDIGSGAAFIMWCAALIVGLIIFVPYLVALI